MVFRHGKRSGVVVETFDLTQFFNSASASHEVDTAETTTFGNDSMTYIVGQRDGTLSLEGFYDGGATAVDARLSPILGTEDGAHVFVQQGYDTADSPGITATFAKGEATSYEITSPVDDVVAITFEVQADGGVFTGVALHDPNWSAKNGLQKEEPAQSLDNASVDNGASTANGFVAQLHVDTNSLDGNAIVTIEDSADDAVFATLGTFATVGAGTTTAEQITGTGTVNRYVRINIDTTAATAGEIAFVVGFARLPDTVDQTP